jgi:hypothetical protein
MLYRTEVGAGAFLASYLVVLILYLAYKGHLVAVRLPGGVSVEPIDDVAREPTSRPRDLDRLPNLH